MHCRNPRPETGAKHGKFLGFTTANSGILIKGAVDWVIIVAFSS